MSRQWEWQVQALIGWRSDHHHLLHKLQRRLEKAAKNSEQLFTTRRLRDTAVKFQFTLEWKIKFQVLADILAEDISALCENIQKTFLATRKEVLGCRKREMKEWISETTYQLIENKRAKHSNLASNEEEKIAASATCRKINEAVKKSARKAKRNCNTNDLAQ